MRRANASGWAAQSRAGWAGVAAALLSLSGCALTPSAQNHTPPSVVVPTAWSAPVPPSAAPAAPGPWWQHWGPAPLTALIGQALQAHTSVRAAQAALRQAQAQVDVQSASIGWLPNTTASTSAQRSRAAGDTNSTLQAGIDAGWELDVAGRLRAGIQASQADARAAAHQLAQAQLALAAEVALNYITLCSQQERLGLAQNNLASQQEILQISQWRLQAGLTTSLVTEQARANTEQTASQIPPLLAGMAQARHSLAVLTGQAAGTLAVLPASACDGLPTTPSIAVLELPTSVLRQRPDVRAAEERVQAASARVAQAQAALYPSLRLSAAISWRALTLGALGTGAAASQALLGSISGPLWDRGAGRAQVAVQDALLEQTRLNYEATVLAALREVEDALIALQTDQQRLQRLENAAQAAQNAAGLAQNRYRSGLIDFQAVLETQRTLLATQDSVASTRASVSADHVRLYKALGGGEQASGPAAPSTTP